MTIYAVQELYHYLDDTVTLFTSRKEAERYWSLMIKDQTHQIVMKKFDLKRGERAYETSIGLPF